MSYFTWEEKGLTEDCESLEAMASRLEEAACLMRRMSKEGFILKKKCNKQLITHKDKTVFEAWGFITEEKPFNQLKLIPEEE
ncbi:hypothetical protein [Prochlorococcus sp. MIT 1341]|uniref:hypothetical protein n=1 Tax=Prochlorococcus sp. MIT 1341 TaxID=3096221 RepID=UPI002A74F2C5|nr:hypothetical protein [Prochlorococcus sp. MIT 1341]